MMSKASASAEKPPESAPSASVARPQTVEMGSGTPLQDVEDDGWWKADHHRAAGFVPFAKPPAPFRKEFRKLGLGPHYSG